MEADLNELRDSAPKMLGRESPATSDTCPFCMMVLDLMEGGALAPKDKVDYGRHLQIAHGLKPFYVPR